MELARFGSVDRNALRWLRTQEAPATYTLLSGDAPVATLVWAHRGGSLATLTSADGSWTLERAGFLNPTVVVRRGDATAPVGRLTAHFRRHAIELAQAPAYRLQHVSHLVPSWKVTTSEGVEVLHIEPIAEHRALSGGAVVVGSRTDAPELLLLVAVSWYFVVLVWLEDELVEALVPFEGSGGPQGFDRST